jgi:hypothetical protein
MFNSFVKEEACIEFQQEKERLQTFCKNATGYVDFVPYFQHLFLYTERDRVVFNMQTHSFLDIFQQVAEKTTPECILYSPFLFDAAYYKEMAALHGHICLQKHYGCTRR